jgi:hypothetical protein
MPEHSQMRNDSAGVHDLMSVYFFITNSLRAKTISPCEEMQIWRGNRMGVERAEGGEASTMPGSWRGRTGRGGRRSPPHYGSRLAGSTQEWVLPDGSIRPGRARGWIHQLTRSREGESTATGHTPSVHHNSKLTIERGRRHHREGGGRWREDRERLRWQIRDAGRRHHCLFILWARGCA